jgi:hypothetical protein
MPKPSSPVIDEQVNTTLLTDNYDVREKDKVRKTFEPHELIEMKDEYFRLSSRLEARLELSKELKQAAESYDNPVESIHQVLTDQADTIDFGSDGVKTLKSSTSALLRKINQGYESIDQTLFGMAYHDVGRMAYYDEHGLFVYDRPLKPGERQGSILTMSKTA